MNEEKKRRRKIVWVPHQFIMDFLTFIERSCVIRPVLRGLPEGFEIVTCEYSVRRDSFGFLIQHSSFDELPFGTKCPEIILEDLTFVKVEGYRKQESR